MKGPRIVLALAVVAVAGVSLAYFAGVIPPKSGIEGTIGAAERYQATQITDKDVVLQDPQIQALLQSDLFHKVIANPDFKKLARQDAFWKTVTSSAFNKSGLVVNLDAARQDKRPPELAPDASRSDKRPPELSKQQVVAELDKISKKNPELSKVISDPSFLQLVQDANFRQLVATDTFQKLATASDVKKIVNEQSALNAHQVAGE